MEMDRSDSICEVLCPCQREHAAATEGGTRQHTVSLLTDHEISKMLSVYS